MLAKFWAIVEAVKVFGKVIDKVDEYIIKPLIKAYKEHQDRKIDKHYAKKAERIERLKQGIEAERKAEATPESDEKLREMVRKLNNLGVEHDRGN